MKKLLLILFVILNGVGCSTYAESLIGSLYNHSKLDSLDMKITPLINNKEYLKGATLMLDKGKLLFDYGMYASAVTTVGNTLNVLEKIDKDKRDESWGDVYVDCLNRKGVSFAYLSNFDKALECYIMIDKYNDNKHGKYAAKAYNGMGVVFAMSNNYRLAEVYYRKALAIANEVKGSNMFSIYSNLGAVFMNRQSLDSALIYFLDAHKIALLQDDKSSEIVSLQALGMVNYQLGRYNLSIKYLNEAADIAVLEENYGQLSYLKFNMVNSYVGLGDYGSAFSVANDAVLLARKTGGKALEAWALKQLSSLYEHQGKYKQAFETIKKGLLINDSIFNHDSEGKLLKQKADFDLYRAQSEQTSVENTLALELANNKINNMIILFVVVSLAVGLYISSSKLIKQYRVNHQLNIQIEHIQINDESRLTKLQEEIDMKSRELTSTSLLIVKFNELSYLLNTKLRILKANLASRSKDMEVVMEMEELIQQFAPEKNWGQFKHYFEQISPNFYDKLDIRYPDMTIGEKRICALISLNLTSKEIASLTGKTSSAIDNAKCRIRKKMDVGLDVNLSDIFSKMKV